MSDWDPRVELFSVEDFWRLLGWAEEGMLTSSGLITEDRRLYGRLTHILETYRSDLLK